MVEKVALVIDATWDRRERVVSKMTPKFLAVFFITNKDGVGGRWVTMFKWELRNGILLSSSLRPLEASIDKYQRCMPPNGKLSVLGQYHHLGGHMQGKAVCHLHTSGSQSSGIV